jgi:hypothetical protein
MGNKKMVGLGERRRGVWVLDFLQLQEHRGRGGLVTLVLVNGEEEWTIVCERERKTVVDR